MGADEAEIADAMDLDNIIDHIASEADDFLEGYIGRPDARAGVSEFITLHYSSLSPDDRNTVTDAVMSILESEGYFEGRATGDGEKKSGA